LAENHLGQGKTIDIAQKLESLAQNFDVEGELRRAREFFAASAKWFQQAGDTAKATEMTVLVAECWAKEAVARISSDKPSHMVAASFYEKAIQIYRTIPRSERATHRADERIAELHKSLRKQASLARWSNQLSLIDITTCREGPKCGEREACH
jgi:hypothetical protein